MGRGARVGDFTKGSTPMVQALDLRMVKSLPMPPPLLEGGEGGHYIDICRCINHVEFMDPWYNCYVWLSWLHLLTPTVHVALIRCI